MRTHPRPGRRRWRGRLRQPLGIKPRRHGAGAPGPRESPLLLSAPPTAASCQPPSRLCYALHPPALGSGASADPPHVAASSRPPVLPSDRAEDPPALRDPALLLPRGGGTSPVLDLPPPTTIFCPGREGRVAMSCQKPSFPHDEPHLHPYTSLLPLQPSFEMNQVFKAGLGGVVFIFLPGRKKKKKRRSSADPLAFKTPHVVPSYATYKIEMPTTHLLRHPPSRNLETHPARLLEPAPGVGWERCRPVP